MAELYYTTALPEDALFVDKLARLSPWTRDFANPPMSLKEMRAVAFEQGEVYICEVVQSSKKQSDDNVVGFIWCRPMKPKHMPFSTVYYMGVDPAHQGKKVAKTLLRLALDNAKAGRIELVCEEGNTAATAFYQACRGEPLRIGTVGKDERPYTRYAFVRGQKGL